MGDDFTQLEPAIRQLAEATGAFQPVQETTGWVADLVRYRRIPHQARMIKRAADKIQEAGIPAAAVDDKLVRACMEHGPMEDDSTMQERWANLLANVLTEGSAQVRSAFPTILNELEPEDAALLDRWVLIESGGDEIRPALDPDDSRDERDVLPSIDNLERLGLVRLKRRVQSTTFGGSGTLGPIAEATVTRLGMQFVAACRGPASEDVDDKSKKHGA